MTDPARSITREPRTEAGRALLEVVLRKQRDAELTGYAFGASRDGMKLWIADIEDEAAALPGITREQLAAVDEAASVAHGFMWREKGGSTREQASDAIWAIHNAIRPVLAAPPRSAAPVEDTERLRYVLWMAHGHEGLYGDDGEMQCGQCHADYLRDPLPILSEKAYNSGSPQSSSRR